MTRYADDAKERVREAVDLVRVVETRTELRQKGADSFFGRCPFHDERTPSFHVRPREGVYYCFGCQAKGDAFRFVMETEGLGFVEAMETLAERFGVELQPLDDDPEAGRRRTREKKLLEALERAAAWYATALWESPEAAAARGYLLGRGLSEEVLREFGVGWAPGGWDRLLRASTRAGWTEEELIAAGLAQRGRGGRTFDRFRERVVFPLADERGRVRGFGARAMRDDQQPKYLNSSENEVFSKGRQLFALDRARRPAAAEGSVVLAEGYTDVLALHQAGVTNAVGLMGTALTDDQVAVLARTAPTLVLALDADRAGQEAMVKAAALAERRKLELRVVGLPEGSDPAELLGAEGADALRARFGRSVPVVSFRVERTLAAADVRTAEGRDRALDEVRPLVRSLPPSVLQEELVRRIAARLELSPALVGTLVGPGRSGPLPARGSASVLSRRERAERDFLVLVLAARDAGAAALARLDLEEHFTSGLLRNAARHLIAHAHDPLGRPEALAPELYELLTELVARSGVPREELGSLEHAELSLELERLDAAIRTTKSRALAVRRRDVQRRMQELPEPRLR